MTAATDYLDRLIGSTATKQAPGLPVASMESMFPSGSASSYLDSLLMGGLPSGGQASGGLPSGGQASGGQASGGQASQAQPGTSTPSAQGDLTDPAYVQQLADHYGWNALPTTFDVSKVTGGQAIIGGEEVTTSPMSYSDPNWKGENSVFRNKADSGAKDELGGSANSLVDSGYRVVAGSVPGTKRFTRAYYNYDDAGKFIGVTTEAKTKWYEDAAPLISMAGMAFGLGGLGKVLGAAANSTLGLGLGATGQGVLGSALMGGGTAALTGQNPLKGAALGTVGGGISAANPAAMAGITNPMAQGALNGTLGGAAGSLLTGQDMGSSLVHGALNGALSGSAKKPNTARS